MTVPILRTTRLTLRPLVAQDADFLVQALADQEVWKWLSVIPQPYTHADAIEFITQIAPGEAWLIEMDNAPQGVIGLSNELGYWLARSSWGQGIITEAGDAVVDWAFTDPDRAEILSGHFNDNTASRNALEKLGFVDAGPKLLACLSDGRTDIPSCHMRLTRARWLSRRHLTIKTPRLLIREFRDSDAADFARICGHPDVAPMLFAMTVGWSEREAFAMIRASRYRGRLPFRAAICKEDRLIGMLGVGGIGRRAAPSLAYALDPAHQGQGLITEAAEAFLTYLDGHFAPPLIEADHFTDNPASGAILRKLGFRQTGTGKGDSRARPAPHPVALFERRTLQTARLLLRPYRPSDAAALCDIVSHWQVVRQLGSWPWPPNPEVTSARAKPFEGSGDVWVITQDQRMIGSIGITLAPEGPPDAIPTIGYMMHPAAQARGLMTEAARAALSDAFTRHNWPRIDATCWADNSASQHLLQKLGFHKTGTSSSFSAARNAQTDEITYSLTKTNWPTPSSSL